MDLIREFGSMTFASRLKRLGDRLKAEATKLYHAYGIEFNDSWYLVAFMLSRKEGISVTEIAEALGISHAAVSQMASAMKDKGLLIARGDARDRRRAPLYLTDDGQAAIEALQPIWNAVGECTDELLASTGQNVLQAISEIEEHLERQSLFTRVKERLDQDNR